MPSNDYYPESPRSSYSSRRSNRSRSGSRSGSRDKHYRRRDRYRSSSRSPPRSHHRHRGHRNYRRYSPDSPSFDDWLHSHKHSKYSNYDDGDDDYHYYDDDDNDDFYPRYYHSRSRSHGYESEPDHERYKDGKTAPDRRRRAPRRSRSPPPPSSSVLIRGLGNNNTEDELRNIVYRVSGCTPVGARILRDKTTGEARGFGFVDFTSVDEARTLLEASAGEMLVGERRVMMEYSRGGRTGSAHGHGSTGSSGSRVTYRDWICEMCQARNFSHRRNCIQCEQPRTATAEEVIVERKPGGGGDSKPQPTCELIVRGLNMNTTEETIRSIFSALAPVKAVRVIRDKHTGVSRGFSFVEFSCIEHASYVLQTQEGLTIDGVVVDMAYARRNHLQPPSQSQPNSQAATQALALAQWNAQYQQQQQQQQQNNQEYSTEVSSTTTNEQYQQYLQQYQQQQQQQQPRVSLEYGNEEQKKQHEMLLQHGFAWDGDSGLYYNTTTHYYYDPHSTYYYNADTGQYMYYDHQQNQYITIDASSYQQQQQQQQQQPDQSSAAASHHNPSEQESLPHQQSNYEHHPQPSSTQQQQQDKQDQQQQDKQQQQQQQQQQPTIGPSLPPTGKLPKKHKNLSKTSNNKTGERELKRRRGKSMTAHLSEWNRKAKELQAYEQQQQQQQEEQQQEKKPAQQSNPSPNTAGADNNPTPSKQGQIVQETIGQEFVMNPAFQEEVAYRRLGQESSAPLPAALSNAAAGKKKGSDDGKRGKKRKTPGGGPQAPIPAAKRAALEAENQAPPKQGTGLDDSNIGSQMLQAMGWRKGEGLGRERSGRKNPLAAEQREERVGLGFGGSGGGRKRSESIKVGSQQGESYQDVARKKARARYEALMRGD